MDGHRPTDEFDDGIFICTCDEVGRREAAALLEEVRVRLDSELATISEELARAGHIMPERRVTDATLIDEVVRSLNRDFSASVEGIGSDLWFGLEVRAQDGSFSTFVQCDSLVHGFAAAWKVFADRR